MIDAVAVDRNGAPVVDLRQDEMEVWIGHFLVPIDSFSAVTPASDDRNARLIVLVLDDMTLPLTELGRARDVARHFVTRMLPGDRMAIVTLDGGSMETTGDRSRLLRAIDTYNVRATGVVRIDVLGEHVLKTMGAYARQLAEASEGRKIIVGIGSGWIFDRPIPPPAAGHDLLPEWVDAMRAMALANVTLYAIDPSGVGARRVDGGDAGFARATGGHAFVSTNDLNGAADRILREASNYYMIGVMAPPVGRDADLRELDVRVKRRGVTVRAREAVSGGR